MSRSTVKLRPAIMTTSSGSRVTPEKLESFVNDHLKVDLAEYEKHLSLLNAETMEYIQLKNMCETIRQHFPAGFKTKVNVGANMFVQARVPNVDTILVDVGLQHFVEFTLDEAIKFCEFKTKVLAKQADVVRDESIKTRAHIKLALLCLGEQSDISGALQTTAAAGNT